MEADQKAPVFAASEIEIAASPEVVWDVLTDLRGWPLWNTSVRSVRGAGSASKGAVFRWKSGGSIIRSTVQVVERPYLLAWTGRVMTIRAVHVWHLIPLEERTLVRTEESFEGLVATLFRRSLQRMLDGSLSKVLMDLRAEAEKRALETSDAGKAVT